MAYTAFSGDATQGTGSHLDVFIPELWADGVYRYFEKNLVFKPFFDDYSSLVQGRGDTLHIPTVQEVASADKSANAGVAYSVNTETDIDLSIDQHKYAAKLFEDIAMIQSNEQLFDKYAQSMAYALAKAVDTKIEALLQTLGTTQTLAADNSMSNADVETAIGTLLSNDIPKEECAFFVNPLIYADLLNSKAFVTNNSGAGVGFGNDNPVMRTGEVGMLFGIPVFTSSLIPTTTSTGIEAGYLVHKSAIAVAVQQDIRVQSEYSVDYLGTKVVADIIYGAVITTSNHVKGIEFLNP
jgi:N4-gp56 family major capsid protein